MSGTGDRLPKNEQSPLLLAGKRSQASLSERLKKVEDECRKREEERVNLELELTEVKESLKKALSGGVTLGLTIEPKAGCSTNQVRPATLWQPAGVSSHQPLCPTVSPPIVFSVFVL